MQFWWISIKMPWSQELIPVKVLAVRVMFHSFLLKAISTTNRYSNLRFLFVNDIFTEVCNEHFARLPISLRVTKPHQPGYLTAA